MTYNNLSFFIDLAGKSPSRFIFERFWGPLTSRWCLTSMKPTKRHILSWFHVFWVVVIEIHSQVFTARRYASAVLAVIVCLSVCLSVRLSPTSRSCTKMAKPRITLRTAYDSPGTLVFRCQKSGWNSNDITPPGTPNRGGVGLKRRFAANISLYLRNGAR